MVMEISEKMQEFVVIFRGCLVCVRLRTLLQWSHYCGKNKTWVSISILQIGQLGIQVAL